MAQRLKAYKTFHDPVESKKLGVDNDTLVTPQTSYFNRIRFKVFEFEELIRSEDIDLTYQIQIAKMIEKHYNEYDGFVVCHGTDTMAYTASTLSFMLENLKKTVVITGSQLPLNEVRSDAVDNLLGSLIVAGPFKIPEVVIYFDNQVIRGNRATKVSSSRLHAFDSPNMEPLAIFNVNLTV